MGGEDIKFSDKTCTIMLYFYQDTLLLSKTPRTWISLSSSAGSPCERASCRLRRDTAV